MQATSFRFRSPYLGVVDYDVLGDGAPYRISVRHQAGAYERSIYNGDDTEWQRDIVGAIGVIQRSSNPSFAVPQAVAAAFNDWRAAEHAIMVGKIAADPRKYGALAADDPILAPPAAARSAAYMTGAGWVS